MEVIVKKKVLRKVNKFPKYVKRDILDMATLLENFPLVRADVRKLEHNIYRIRRGKYRMLFRIEENLLIVFEINIRGRISYD